MTCSVLRCQNTGSHVMTVREEPTPVEVVVCERHHQGHFEGEPG